uniref:CFAP65 fourth Ig-like domain-containing protein n=1 Tax=Electrophorus electricus TaxID=8005 RepID=A0AAY5F236_ELEEL
PCAVRHSSGTGFLLRNVSKLRTGFQWAVEPPFELSPVRGILEPGGECKVTATFKPDQALVYQAEASCTFGEDGESRCTMYLRGLSKYPHLQIISPDQEDGCGLLEFGSVAIGSSSEKQFEICNPSSVSHPEAAHLSTVPVCFTPLAVDSASADYLSLTCLGAVSRCLLKVTGSCIGPDVSLSSSLVDFGCVEEGGEAVSIIHIINSSTVLAYYQFDMDPGSHSVFSVDQLSGNLPANSSLTLRLTFRPRYPIAYHKRSACLILHRDPLFLDLIGTCHSEELKPTILHSRHLRVYRQNLLRGLTCYPPDILSAMLAEDKLQLDESGSLLLNEEQKPYNSLECDLLLQETSRAAVSLRSPMEEYFHPGWVDEPRRFPTPHVTVHPSELHFDPGLASQSVSITNRTKGKLSLLWTPSADSPFSVTPLNCDLSPLKSTAFRVTYAPKQHNTFHAAQLECFALYKVNTSSPTSLCCALISQPHFQYTCSI